MNSPSSCSVDGIDCNHTELLHQDGEDSKERACDSLIMCIITTMNQGLRNGGGIGDILRAPSSAVNFHVDFLDYSTLISNYIYYAQWKEPQQGILRYVHIYIYIYCACSCVPILILYSNCFQNNFLKISLYLVMFIFLSGANVCSARDLRPAVLLRRYHHCIEFDFWCHYRHFCRFEE